MKTLLTIIALQDLFSCLGVLERSLYMKQRWFSRLYGCVFYKNEPKIPNVEPTFSSFWYPMFQSGIDNFIDSVVLRDFEIKRKTDIGRLSNIPYRILPVVCPLHRGVSRQTSASCPRLTCSSLAATLLQKLLCYPRTIKKKFSSTY